MTQSIGPTTDTLRIVKSIDYLITLQREERIEKEKQLKEEKAEKEKQLKEEKAEKEKQLKEEIAEKEKQLKEEKEERERLYDLRERKEKEHKAEKERLLELKERQLKEEKVEKEGQLKEEKAEKDRLFELKEKKEKEEREERWRIEREDRIEREKLRADKLAEREAKDRKDQLDREQRKAEFERLLLNDKHEREQRDRLRDEKDAKDRRERLEEMEKDRLSREQRYQDEKDERMEKESRRDSRLKRATDNLKGRLSEQPEDLKSMINFFKIFESSFIGYNVDEDLKVSILIPYLNNRSKRLVLALETGTTFEQVKVAILAEYNFSPRMYRSAFLDAFRSLGESAVQFVTRITNSLELYLDSRGINKDYNRLLELMVSDRFRDTLDEETRHYVADHEHDGWMLPKRMAQLIDAYQSERHPNWNYLRNPKNFGSKPGNSGYRSSSSYKGTPGGKHEFVKYDRTRLFCTYCKGKGHLKSTCFKLTKPDGKSYTSKKDAQSQPSKVRSCYVCNSKNHLASSCPDKIEKKSGKTYSAKRVTVDSVSQNLILPIKSTGDKVFHFNDLLISAGVHEHTSNVSFKPIDYKYDLRVNAMTGVYGFIPYLDDKADVRLCTEEGGIALHDQLVGDEDDEVDHLDLDDNQLAIMDDEGEVEAGIWGGGLRSGFNNDLNKLFNDDEGSDTTTESMHTSNMYKHNKEHVVNVDFNGHKIPMLLDSGTQISVVKTGLIPHSSVSNDSTNQVKLLGAFGKPVPATVISIKAILSTDNNVGLSNQSGKMLNIALCDELNGDTGLLSINDFNILCGRSAFIPDVKIKSYSGRVSIIYNTEDDDDVLDESDNKVDNNNSVDDNKEDSDDDSNEVNNVADNSIESIVIKNDIQYYDDNKVSENYANSNDIECDDDVNNTESDIIYSIIIDDIEDIGSIDIENNVVSNDIIVVDEKDDYEKIFRVDISSEVLKEVKHDQDRKSVV